MKRLLCLVSMLTVAVVLALPGGFGHPSMAAEPAGRWAPVQRVSGYASDSDTPYLVADQNRTVHAFSSQLFQGSRVAVGYARWTLAGGWSNPVDVLLSPGGGEARVSGAYLDPSGMMHVIFFGKDDRSFSIYHSQAPAAAADRAPSWSRPVVAAEAVGLLFQAALAADDQGNLFVVYSGGREGPGLYSVHSPDWGASWAKPVLVFATPEAVAQVAYVQAQADSQARLHVVWSVVDDSGRGRGIYYARLEGDHQTWSSPKLLAARIDYSAEHPTLVEHNGELFVVFLNGSPPKRWMQRSSDGGHSWSGSVPIVDGWIGGNGPAWLANDSSGVLHMFFGNRIPPEPGSDIWEIHGMWHSVWLGDEWSRPEAVISGPTTAAEGGVFDPWTPRAVASQGDVMLLVWKTDPGTGGNGIWYSYKRLDAPELPVVALPTPLTAATPTPNGTARIEAASFSAPTMTPRPSHNPAIRSGSSARAAVSDPTVGWLLSVLPVLLLVSAVVGVKTVTSRRH